MRRAVARLKICGWVIGVQAVFACASLATSAKPQWSPVAITDLKTIAGKWEGIMIRTPKARDDDWVSFTIQTNGDYKFVNYRQIGVFSGKGTLSVKDGKATAQNERATLTVQLFTEASGQPMLRVEGKGKSGLSYRAELKKAVGTQH